MSPYRHLIVCAILFFVLFYGSANFVKAEPISADCDYEHVLMLFGAKVEDFWTRVDPYRSIPPDFTWTHIVRPIKNSTYGLPYDSLYNLVTSPRIIGSRDFFTEVIDMRDVARAIQNYQKSQST